MTFTANAAATTAHTIVYSSKALTAGTAAATVATGAYTLVTSAGGRTVELRVTVDRRNARAHTLPTSIPSAVDPLSTRSSNLTLAVSTGTKRGKLAAASQWDR